MSYEELNDLKNTQESVTLMRNISNMTRRDIVSFFREHKETIFNNSESEELVNKLIKRQKWKYIFSHLNQLNISDYNAMINNIINAGGGKYVVIYLGKIDELNIKLDMGVRDRLEELGFLKASSRHKNVFITKKNNIRNKPIISPSDPRNFRG